MEVGVEVWVKGYGDNEGWFGGSVIGKVCSLAGENISIVYLVSRPLRVCAFMSRNLVKK